MNISLNDQQNDVVYGYRSLQRRKQKFSQEEDEFLRLLVSQHGERGWRKIAELMPGRTARQIRERWLNYLSPNVSLEPWTAEEDKLMISLYSKNGTNWAKVVNYFPNRTPVALKNRWATLKKRIRSDIITNDTSVDEFQSYSNDDISQDSVEFLAFPEFNTFEYNLYEECYEM